MSEGRDPFSRFLYAYSHTHERRSGEGREEHAVCSIVCREEWEDPNGMNRTSGIGALGYASSSQIHYRTMLSLREEEQFSASALSLSPHPHPHPLILSSCRERELLFTDCQDFQEQRKERFLLLLTSPGQEVKKKI